jgi:GGDEF domain-containing protein
MGLKEAKEYIRRLHKLQGDPYKWPDYLTGLPDRTAILKTIGEVYAKQGKHSISLVRISNVHSYLLKYGSSRHAEIIQWAAAILKTTAAEYKGAFVGAAGTHEFVVICRPEYSEELLRKARDLFVRKTRSFYDEKDLENNYILSFERDGEKIHIGFMDLLYSSADTSGGIEKNNIIPHLARLCTEMEEI